MRRWVSDRLVRGWEQLACPSFHRIGILQFINHVKLFPPLVRLVHWISSMQCIDFGAGSVVSCGRHGSWFDPTGGKLERRFER